MEHGLLRKPVSTFRDHALSVTRSASQPCGRKACVARRAVVSRRQRRNPMTVETPAAAIAPDAKLIAILCGVGAAACWGVGLVAARHGIAIGLSPTDLAFHRFMWSGLIMLPFAWLWGMRDLGGIGWGTGIALMILGGPGLSILSHAGFILAPLGDGAVIQPSTATLGGLLLATLILREHLSA